MFRNGPLKALYTVFNWALFALGVHELALLLTTPAITLVVTFLCGCIFVLGLHFANAKILNNKNTMVLSTGMVFLCLTVAYNCTVVLQSATDMFVFNTLSVVAFVASAFLTLHFLYKPVHGAH